MSDPGLVLGILGGVGSGKSTAATFFADRGFALCDADAISQEILCLAELRDPLVELFGERVLGAEGSIDRRVVAERVFTDRVLRRRFERLLHPRVAARLERRIDEARAAGQRLVIDAPLLVEKGLWRRCDRLLFVETPERLRRERALARGMGAEDWERREAAQAPVHTKRSLADLVVENEGDPSECARALAEVLGKLVEGP